MGVEARMVASIALNLDMEVLTDPVAPRARIKEVARELVALGAEVVITARRRKMPAACQ
jgi:hypothetical protein